MTPAKPETRYYVGLRDREYVVEIRETDAGLAVSLDGRAVAADLVRLTGPSVYSLLLDGNSREMVLARDGDRVQVSLDGERYEVRVQDEVGRALSGLGGDGTGALEVLAPMPGVIVSVAVAAGDVVQVGEPVVVMEAMKMQNELTAESAGVVDRVAVQQGDTVEGGALLVVLEPEAEAG